MKFKIIGIRDCARPSTFAGFWPSELSSKQVVICVDGEWGNRAFMLTDIEASPGNLLESVKAKLRAQLYCERRENEIQAYVGQEFDL